MAHGKCLKGKHILLWDQWPRLRDAYCPHHKFPLTLTSRHSKLPPLEEHPWVGPRHPTKGDMKQLQAWLDRMDQKADLEARINALPSIRR